MNDFNMSNQDIYNYVLDVISGYENMLNDPNQTEWVKEQARNKIIKLQRELKKFE